MTDLHLQDNIVLKFLEWYFWEMPGFIMAGWKNFLLFGLNYFSVPLLIKTFFAPWRKYRWSYPRGFDLWNYFESFFSNIIFRTLGALFRSVLIVAGIICELLIIIMGFAVLCLWLIIPFAVSWGFFHGFRLVS